MISAKLQCFALALIILYFIALVLLLKKGHLNLKYSLLWMFCGVVLLILAVFPGLLDRFAALVGIYSSVNAFFAVVLFCGLILTISITSIASHQRKDLVRLTQRIALLEKEIRDLRQTACSDEEAKES